jgi:hypothetical protein
MRAMPAVSTMRSPAIPSLPGNTPRSRKSTPRPFISMKASVHRPRAPCRSCSRRSMPSRRAIRRVAQSLRADLGVFRQALAADTGLVGEPGRAGAIVADRRDRRGAGEEPERYIPDRVVEHERARHPRFGGGSAAARAGGVRARRPRRRHHRAARQLSGFDVDGAKGGTFRLQFGNKPMTKDEIANLINLPPKKLKKSQGHLNVRRPSATHHLWERLSLPIEAVFGASAHPPKRPYGLTRPVVPPDGSFVFVGYFGRFA